MEGMEEIIQDFLVETDELIQGLEGDLIELEKNPEDKDLLNRIFRSFHTIKGASGFLGFNQIVELSHALEDLLNKLRGGELKVTPSIMDGLLEGLDMLKKLVDHVRNGDGVEEDLTSILSTIKGLMSGEGQEVSGDGDGEKKESSPQSPAGEPKMVGEILVEQGTITQDQLLEAIKEQKGGERLGDVLVRKGYATKEDVEKALSTQRKETPSPGAETTVRVDAARLDDLMNMVGELVLERNRIMRLTDQLEDRYGDDDLVVRLRQATYNLDIITGDLQLSVMKTRMQPVARVFSRFPRMVRDISRAKGKEVELVIEGQETELDKTIIEEIGDPLIHLIRNAIDHGIEPPDEREEKGKPRKGRVLLSASYKGGGIEITVEDDGRGIDIEKVGRKAVEKGLVTEEDLAGMMEKDVLNLIFHPGFSTAEEVTDISGRGVGMDVVKSNIVKVGGTIEIDTEKGKGTRITLNLPLTLAIIQTLMVRAGGEDYVIPLSSVTEIIGLEGRRVQTINGREAIEFRGRIHPVVRLASLVGAMSNGDSKYALIMALGEKRLALLVEGLGSQEEVVIKSLGGYLSKVRGLSGATITGDGKVIPILDVSDLFQGIEGP